ncbi:hypothetical protein B0G75_13235 [Paraburkholderia sp. BL18I3N2]|nr:hypothetical protein B0G75_13235 [Paraburkholderia sp. BL18I3N2]
MCDASAALIPIARSMPESIGWPRRLSSISRWTVLLLMGS